MQYNGGKDMTSGSFTSTADMDFYIDVDANGTELVIVSDNITTRHQVRLGRHLLLLLLPQLPPLVLLVPLPPQLQLLPLLLLSAF
jgi:hypothetical protein